MSSPLRSAQRRLAAAQARPIQPVEEHALDRMYRLAVGLVARARPVLVSLAPEGVEGWLRDAEILLGPMPKAPEAAQAPARQPDAPSTATPEAQPAAEAADADG